MRLHSLRKLKQEKSSIYSKIKKKKEKYGVYASDGAVHVRRASSGAENTARSKITWRPLSFPGKSRVFLADLSWVLRNYVIAPFHRDYTNSGIKISQARNWIHHQINLCEADQRESLRIPGYIWVVLTRYMYTCSAQICQRTKFRRR